ncbi:MAG: hypothetical protein UT30_C0009G0032 [Candidatus Uhrbacteria bacterium GW2011_GWF2_39_13]|uniref:DUF916 domain-containing protein n=1 Tax=Candidatus Uhrbacteria bacterium GW2011_GWF2_39_13 TaxID=1618995 RepID=A0A0G0QRR6_9BACT|nr:MAG: hypothetical protein UT30_C0009G0032 [Candidatus Uhrbacteria bacterium GW2011_GWF2_39_13]
MLLPEVTRIRFLLSLLVTFDDMKNGISSTCAIKAISSSFSKIFRILSVGCCSLALLLISFGAHAAVISPSMLEISSARGEVIHETFTILNTGSSEQTYFFDRVAFKPMEESGTPLFSQETKEASALTSWISFPETQVRVLPASKADVPFEIAIPDDIASGGYYAAITVSPTPTDIVTTNGAIIDAKTAILVLLTVEGETTQQLQLLDFHGALLSSSLPFSSFQFRVQNQGNVHVVPRGQITLKGFFGQTIQVIEVNTVEGRVLPSSTRQFEAQYPQETLSWLGKAGYQLSHLSIGPMTADLALSYGSEGTLFSSLTFWIVPWELILVLAGVIGIILACYYGIQKKIKSKRL